MNLCDLKHPLREEPGSSQLKRANDVLQAATVPIDGRTWADILDYLYRYSRQINFPDFAQSEETAEFTRSGDWRVFLEKSLPFLLARISKLDGEAIEQNYSRLQSGFERMPGPDTFNSLLDFCFEELIEPIFNWFETLSREERIQREAAGVLTGATISEFRFKRLLADMVSAGLKQPLHEFIKTYQKAQNVQVVTQRNFFPFINQQIWGLKVTDLVKPVDTTSVFDREESARLLAEEVFGKFLNMLRQISRSAPDYIAESLKPLQEDFRKRHDPHLALLFTFLELFQYVQGDINRLSEKHLDFFYRQVLRIQPKPHRPDHAHLVFEVAKHLEQYLLKKDTVFKDGKDNNKTDVLFALDEEIVLDKAAIGSLRTLYLNQAKVPAKPKKEVVVNGAKYCTSQEVIALEGVYMAPVANSADGLGQAFPENQIPNWATLGAKESKSLAPGKSKLDQHPYARIGVMLASPVLLLQEGKREIVITLYCDFNGNESIKEVCLFFNKLDRALKQPYYKLTEAVLQKLATAFRSSKLEEVREAELTSENEINYYITTNSFSAIEQTLLKCYMLGYFEIWQKSNPKSDPVFGQSKEWNEMLSRLENPLSDAGRAYLSGLLASRNPYIFSYDLMGCLDVKEEPSCTPLFSPCDKEILEMLMEREDRGMCYLDCCNYDKLSAELKKKLQLHLPAQFPKKNPKECLPVIIDMEQIKGLNAFTPEELRDLEARLLCDNFFKVSLSGQEGWHVPRRLKTEVLLNETDKPGADDCQPKVCKDYFFDNEAGEPSRKVKFRITMALDEAAPPIICYDKEIHEEDYNFENPWPVAKIELNNELKLDFSHKDECDCCKDTAPKEVCCLAKKGDDEETKIALYHFFRNLQVVDTGIEVKVCGIKKNIVIQNDENLLDPNSPFQPFGVRPVVVDADNKKEGDETPAPAPPVGSCPSPPVIPNANLSGPCFYLGSNEILKKCWKDICIHLNWKDKPGDLKKYYTAYDPNLEISDFEVNISVLEGGNWHGENISARPKEKACCPEKDYPNTVENPSLKGKNPCTLNYNRELFKEKGDGCACKCPKDLPPYPSPFPFEQTIKIDSRYFPLDKNKGKDVCRPASPYQADTKDGFIRFCLENRDFFHNQYAYVLSRQMIALSNYPKIVPGAVYVNSLTGDETEPDPNAPAITIEDLFDWICKAKKLADILTSNPDADATSNPEYYEWANIDFFNLQQRLHNLKQQAEITRDDIQLPLGLGYYVNELGSKLAPLNTLVPNHGLVDDEEIFELVWGANPPPVISLLPPYILSSLKGQFEKLSQDFLNNPTGVLPRIISLVDFLGASGDSSTDTPPKFTLFSFLNFFKSFLAEKCNLVDELKKMAIPIPNEPWTPTIKNICLDYSACAGKDDIDIVHLYPFEGTYKHEDLEANPTLLPVFEDEGTLYIGLNNLRPGSGLNLLFQLAEATADSERDRALVKWYHLANNQWQELRPGFEVISDETKGLTVSGIVKIALPKGITRTGNTVMPPDLFWIKAAVSEVDDAVQCEIKGDDVSLQPIQKVKAISEAIAVHTQAARVTFKPESANDLLRLARELPAGSITKMAEPEAGVKKTAQPYASFHGLPPESGNSFYKRVSEHLRHKGRAIAPFDYETLVLEAFPQIFKVKCLNHVFGLSAGDYSRDLDWAPGFISIAVVPDLTKLKPGQDLEPRAPVSLLEEIKAYLKTKISPFVRLKVMNPRFEKVDINVRVRLRKGKDKAFYAARLKEDLTNLLAPWYITRDSDKLVFGQAVSESEVIQYIESLDYVDFITCLSLSGDEDGPKLFKAIGPVTARSILTAGEICVIVDEDDCDAYSDTPADCFGSGGNDFPFHQVCKTPAPPDDSPGP